MKLNIIFIIIVKIKCCRASKISKIFLFNLMIFMVFYLNQRKVISRNVEISCSSSKEELISDDLS